MTIGEWGMGKGEKRVSIDSLSQKREGINGEEEEMGLTSADIFVNKLS